MNLEARLEGLVTTAELADRPDFTLGLATVSPSMRKLIGPGGKADVEPRVMQLLVVLADSKGSVVTRDTLFRRCWGSPAVTDDSLNRAIGVLRKLAEGVGDGSFEVETIPRTGYRLTATSPGGGAVPVRGGWSRRRLMVGGLAGVAAVGGGLIGTDWLRDRAQERRVAQLIAGSEVELRSGIETGGKAAIGLLEQAVAMAPSSALAWGRLALARCQMAENAPPAAVSGAVAGTQAAAQRGLAIDPRQADALAALALLPHYFGDWLAAERRMAGVLAVDPEHLVTRDARAFMHVAVGREREGSTDRLKLADREPLHVGHQFKLVYAYWILGRVAEADRAADRALQLWPDHPATWFARLWTLGFTGRPERALAHVEDAAGRPKLPPGTLEALRAGMTALASGRPADSAVAVDSVIGMLAKGPSHSVNAVMILNGLGEIDRAFDVAHAYLLERGPLLANVRWRPDQLTVDAQRRRKTNMLFVPIAAAMQADPRFMPLVRDIGLVRYWEGAGVTPDFLRRTA